MTGPSGERVTEWAGGSLAELMSVLSAAALPACIRVFAPGAGNAQAGEVHLLAGGINDAFAGDKRGQDAVLALQQVSGARFVIDTRLPDPETGSLAKPGPGEGNLAQRPLVEVMRYCETYVLTCSLEVWRGEEQARISYRRGELVGTTVGGSDAPERLPEVMAWKEGFFEIDLPLPVTPPAPAPSRRNTGTSAVVGDSVPARQTPAERPRRETDPFISLDAIKKAGPSRPASAPVRPAGTDGAKLPRVPSLPGFKSRLTPAAGSRVAPPGPARSTAAAPIRGVGLPSTPMAGAPVPTRNKAPGTTQAAPAAHPLPGMGSSARTARLTPALGTPTAGLRAGVPAAAASPPTARTPITERLAHAPLPQARPGTASPLAPVPWPAAKPAGPQASAQPTPPPAAETAPTDASPSQSAAASPPPASPVSSSTEAPTAPLRVKPPSPVTPAPAPVTPAPAAPAPGQVVLAAVASQATESVAPPQAPERPATPPPQTAAPSATPAPVVNRGATPAPEQTTSSAVNHISGEIGRRPSKSLHAAAARPFGVELADDMQDPAAMVDTPAPQSVRVSEFLPQTTPTPLSPSPERSDPPTVRLSPVAAGRPEELAVDFEDSRVRLAKRPARRGIGDWPWVVHVLLGIALGAAVVAAYSAYYGLPLP